MKYLCKLVPLPIAKIIGAAMNQDSGNACLENLPEELFGTEMELEMRNGWFENDDWAVAPFFIEEIWPKQKHYDNILERIKAGEGLPPLHLK